MKRKMFSLVMLLLCMVSSSELYAFNEGAIGQRIPCPGKLTRVYMNGEKTVGQSVTAYLTKTSEGVYTVELGEFQVGSMPGSIQILAPNVNVASDGSFNMPAMNKIVVLRLFGLSISTKKFNANLSGNLLSDGKLKFTVETVNAKYLGIPFTAIVTFEEN